MMFAKVVCVLSVAFSIVTVDAVVNSKRWGNNDGECGALGSRNSRNYNSHWQSPFVASIFYLINDRIYFICGGTIISKFAIITGE
jgi:hypothetical protein